MCLAVVALHQHERYPLVVAANRDEFFARAAAPLGWWQADADGPEILGGRDLSAGGTWMGLTRAGRLGLLTNIRNPADNDPAAPSRGTIVPMWLRGDRDMDALAPALSASGYNGFNLLALDFGADRCHWLSNRGGEPKALTRGLHALSNAQIDTPWPKVEEIKARTSEAAARADGVEALAASLFEALADRRTYPDEHLPATGVPLYWERLLSAAFVATPDGSYGTRCSTVLITERLPGAAARLMTTVIERTFDPAGTPVSQARYALADWPPRMD